LEALLQRRHLLRGMSAGTVIGVAGCARAPTPETQDSPWRSDGAGLVARLGVLTPHFDPVPETEMAAIAPAGVSLHAARVRWNGGARAFADPPHVDEATALLAGEGPRNLNPNAILFAFTSSSYALGREADAQVRSRLEQLSRGIPVIFTCDAALEALRLLSVHRVSLIHPPWFSETASEQGRAYFSDQGFDIVYCAPMAPSRSLTEVDPKEVFAFVSEHTPSSAEAVFVGGNGLRVAGAIEALEAQLGRPVISANQVLLWSALRSLGHAARAEHYGTIFKRG
jgi:maleate isomerase